MRRSVPAEKGAFPLVRTVQTGSGCNRWTVQFCSRGRVKRSGREVDRLPPRSAEFKNEWSSICAAPIRLCDVHSCDFTFYHIFRRQPLLVIWTAVSAAVSGCGKPTDWWQKKRSGMWLNFLRLISPWHESCKRFFMEVGLSCCEPVRNAWNWELVGSLFLLWKSKEVEFSYGMHWRICYEVYEVN